MTDDEKRQVLVDRIRSGGFNSAITSAATRWDFDSGGLSRGDYITNAAIEFLLGEPGRWTTKVSELGIGFAVYDTPTQE